MAESLSYPLFVASAPGLEALLASELAEFGHGPLVVAGGVELSTDLGGVYRILYGCRLGLSVRVRCAHIRSTQFAHLERQLAQVPFSRWLPPDTPIHVRASARRSRLYHTGAIAERVQRALRRSLGTSAEVSSVPEAPPLTVHARMERDRLTLSVDICGEPLHRRGYRKRTGKAPLREDLAAALLRVAGYDGRGPVLDPVCGAGTLVIEAGLMAGGRSACPGREFAISRLPFHDPKEHAAALPTSLPASFPPLWGSDRDAGAVEAAEQNGARAELAPHLRFACRSLGACRLPALDAGERGLIVANPPYGKRIGRQAALRDLYASLGALRRSAGPGYRLALITSEPMLAHATGIRLRPALLTDLGGTKVRLYCEEAEDG